MVISLKLLKNYFYGLAALKTLLKKPIKDIPQDLYL